MRFSTPNSIHEPIWICLLVLCAGCAIETDDPLVEVDPGRFLNPRTDPEPPYLGIFDPEPETNETQDVFEPISLQGAAPNPINSQTRLSFAVPRGGARVILAIYGIDGRRVKLLVDEVLEDGEYSAFWYGRNDRDQQVPSGVYIISLRRGKEVKTRKVVLLQ